MKTFLAILFITVVLAAVSCSEAAEATTIISNYSTRRIGAAVNYGEGRWGFKNFRIEPFSYGRQSYWSEWPGGLDIEIWIEDNPSHGWVKIDVNRNIIAYDSGPAIDIFLVRFGSRFRIDDEAEKLATIYPW